MTSIKKILLLFFLPTELTIGGKKWRGKIKRHVAHSVGPLNFQTKKRSNKFQILGLWGERRSHIPVAELNSAFAFQRRN